MRIATFNVENLDLEPTACVPINQRIELLKPQLLRLDCDILCLQEINGQKISGHRERKLLALDKLVEDTPYEAFNRIVSNKQSQGISDVHNLVVLSKYSISHSQSIFHRFVPPQIVEFSQTNQIIEWDRPILFSKIALEDGSNLNLFNVHLRAPLASPIPEQKISPFVWKSVTGWAKGFYISELKRLGQILELRLAIEELLEMNSHERIVICGDFNASDFESILKIVIAAEEDTGNGELADRNLVLLDRGIPEDLRYTTLHHGRPQMVDHILVNRPMLSFFKSIEVHNETLSDELVSFSKLDNPPDSYHAPLVAEFLFKN